LTGPIPFYYVALLVLAACSVLMMRLVRSPFGLTLRGIRENERRMKSLGFNTWVHCYLSYVVSGAFASVAGVMWAYYNGFVSPTYLDLTASSELFLMVTLGGPATLAGPVFGAGAIVLLKNVMSAYTARWLLVLGIVYIVTIMWAPQGLWNLGKCAHDDRLRLVCRSSFVSSRSRCLRACSRRLAPLDRLNADQDRVHGAVVGRERAERPRHPEWVPAVPGRNRLPRRRTEDSS
jgi:hypothetical protein